jgi:hypothetical protein
MFTNQELGQLKKAISAILISPPDDESERSELEDLIEQFATAVALGDQSTIKEVCGRILDLT